MTDNVIRERIEKLLRLGQKGSGATEAEAAQAMAIAAALMAKYGIDVALREDGDDEAAVRGDWFGGDQYDKKWHILVADAVHQLYACKYVVGSPRGSFQFVGRPDVIWAAETTFKWLCEQVETLYKECLPPGMTKADRAEYRRTFKLACANRIRERAWQILQAMVNDDALALECTGSTALVVQNARNEDIAAAEALLSDTQALTMRESRSGIGTRWGKAAAELVQLQNTMEGNKPATRLALEHKS